MPINLPRQKKSSNHAQQRSVHRRQCKQRVPLQPMSTKLSPSKGQKQCYKRHVRSKRTFPFQLNGHRPRNAQRNTLLPSNSCVCPQGNGTVVRVNGEVRAPRNIFCRLRCKKRKGVCGGRSTFLGHPSRIYCMPRCTTRSHRS